MWEGSEVGVAYIDTEFEIDSLQLTLATFIAK